MELEIRQHESFQRWEWRFVRAGWVIIALLVLAGLLGALGPGPLSWTTRTGGAGLITVDYQRIGHLEADDGLRVRIDPSAVTGDDVVLLVSSDWLDGLDLSGISPEPSEQTTTPDGLELRFAAQPGSAIEIQFTYRARSVGWLHGRAAVAGDSLRFRQLILP